MDTNSTQLNENQRVQLDGIVSKMVANKEPDSAIQFVVNDFKQKYGTPQEEKPGFFKSLYQGIAGPVANLIARPGQAVQHAMGDTQPIEGKFLGLDITDPYADVSRGKSPISTVSSDIGRGVQTALLGVGGGTTSVASKLELS